MKGLSMRFRIRELVECAEREVRIRRRVYANRVLTKRMSASHADRQIALMAAIVDTLKAIEEAQNDRHHEGQSELFPTA
jgi:hypothetical protein